MALRYTHPRNIHLSSITSSHDGNRAELAELQGVRHSVYSEINPLHLPEVLSLVGLNYGQGELFVALKSSIAGVLSTVNRKECLKQRNVAPTPSNQLQKRKHILDHCISTTCDASLLPCVDTIYLGLLWFPPCCILLFFTKFGLP